MTTYQRGPVRVEPVNGGQVVYCRLCGKKFNRKFWASDTNYAEALRLATAFASNHRMSEAHRAAVAAFYSEEPPTPVVSDQEAAFMRIFGIEPPTEMELRKRAARSAAERARLNH